MHTCSCCFPSQFGAGIPSRHTARLICVSMVAEHLKSAIVQPGSATLDTRIALTIKSAQRHRGYTCYMHAYLLFICHIPFLCIFIMQLLHLTGHRYEQRFQHRTRDCMAGIDNEKSTHITESHSEYIRRVPFLRPREPHRPSRTENQTKSK